MRVSQFQGNLLETLSFFSKRFGLLHSSPKTREDGGAAKSLGRRPGAASTAARCGVRRHTPLGPSPVPGATPRQVLETGRPEQKDRTCNDCVFNGLSGCQVRGSSIIRHFDPTQPLPEDMAITTTSGFMCNSCYKRILIWRKEQAARRGTSRRTRSQAAQSLPVPVAARATRATEVENLALTGESVMRVTLSFVSAHMMLRCVSGQEALSEEEEGTDEMEQEQGEEGAGG